MNFFSSTPWLFKIHPLTSMIDLSNIYVITEMRLMEVDKDKNETKALTAKEVVAPIQV